MPEATSIARTFRILILATKAPPKMYGQGQESKMKRAAALVVMISIPSQSTPENKSNKNKLQEKPKKQPRSGAPTLRKLTRPRKGVTVPLIASAPRCSTAEDTAHVSAGGLELEARKRQKRLR